MFIYLISGLEAEQNYHRKLDLNLYHSILQRFSSMHELKYVCKAYSLYSIKLIMFPDFMTLNQHDHFFGNDIGTMAKIVWSNT